MNDSSIDRGAIQGEVLVERTNQNPSLFDTELVSAARLGLDVQLICEYHSDPDFPGSVRRRYRLTVWVPADKAEMREALANLELQRDKRARARDAIESVR